MTKSNKSTTTKAASKTSALMLNMKKAVKAEAKAVKKFLSIRDAIDPLLLARKYTDMQIAKKTVELCRHAYDEATVAKMRSELNHGHHEKYPAPKKPIVKIGK